MELLDKTVKAIRAADAKAMDAARARQDQLTKPAGSLGLLEEISVKLAGMRRTERPTAETACVFVMAGDHGVAAEGVSAFPQEVTPQMVMNFISGGAAINVLARQAGARVAVTDVGVIGDLPEAPNLHRKKIRGGTSNMCREAAMTRDEAVRSVEVGIEVFEAEYAKAPFDMACTGDMGIANTTPSSAIVSAITGLLPRDTVGRGTGIDDSGVQRKVSAVERALALHKPVKTDALDVLAKVGGFEIGAISGVILAAAAKGIPVLVDGFISTSGALLAAGISPLSKDYMISAHKSVEKGQAAALSMLGLKPLIDFEMRLGEGTGAALAIHLVRASARILSEMATFGEAGVSEA